MNMNGVLVMNRSLLAAAVALLTMATSAAEPDYRTIRMGTVHSLAGGRVLEILIAETAPSYGYTQPAKMGEFYSLYHGFMEARPRMRMLHGVAQPLKKPCSA
jgi:hypothetical protein